MHAAAPSLPQHANRHFLSALIELSSREEIEVHEDVCNADGINILRAGTRVSRELLGEISGQKLRKPIETSLSVPTTIGPPLMMRDAERLLDESVLLRRVCNWSYGEVTPLSLLSDMKFARPVATLLAVADSRNPQARGHWVLVALLAMGLVHGYRYGDQELLRAALTAGIFHDLGELYLDPTILQPHQQLSADGWMAYCSHSVIGAALARDIGGCDPIVQRAVLEHHERLDGFGYPRGLHGKAVSELGQILGLAETLSALIYLPGAERRIEIALKIMPGEYDPSLVSFVRELLGADFGVDRAGATEVDADVLDSIHGTFARIAMSLEAFETASAAIDNLSPASAGAIEEAYGRFIRVQRAFASTGIAGLGELRMQVSESELRELRFEAMCVLGEIKWRLMKLSRELVLKGAALAPSERESMNALAQVLAGA